MKKHLGLMVAFLALLMLWCTTAGAASWETKYNKVPSSRMTVSLPDGMEGHADIKKSEGKIEVLIKASEMTRDDWKAVMIDGGYPNVIVRPGVKSPSGYETAMSFNGGIFDCVEDDFFNTFANELRNHEGVWYNNHAVQENGETVGEIVAEQCMLIPEPSSSGGGGYFICWMDLDKYRKLYPVPPRYDEENNLLPEEEWERNERGEYIVRHQFTADEIKANKDGLFYFEYVEIIVRIDLTEPFYVPFRSVPAAMMKPTEKASLPKGISVKNIVNGDITFEAQGLQGNVDTPVVFDAPAGAASLAVYSPIHGSLEKAERINVVNDRATYVHQVHADVCVSEEQLAAVWLDSRGNMVDYGIFWFHVETLNYMPSGYYVKNAELAEGQTVTWYTPGSDRVKLINNCSTVGVETTYDPASGIFHIGYDEVDEVSGGVDWVGIRVKAPEGATAARINHGGGNQIMGPRDDMASSTHHIIVEQSYIDTQVVDEDGYITVIDMQPLRHYAAGPVDVYLQFGSVWPYGGGQSVIYWYKDKETADNPATRGNPMRIEYVADTTDVICVTSRTEIVDSEEDIRDEVDNVTCVKPGHGGKDWHLVIHRYPQRGDNACHWELYLENECGDYEPLDGNTVFYMPYPNGHRYDESRGCAVDGKGNEASYEIYHYNSDYDQCADVEAQPTKYGIRFVVSSLSPFVLDWGDFQGDLLPDLGDGDGGNDDGGNDDGGNNGDGDNAPHYQLKNLHLNNGTTTVKGALIENVQAWSCAKATIKDSWIKNISMDYSEEHNGYLKFEHTGVGRLNLLIGNRTPINASKALVSFDEESALDVVSVVVFEGEEGPTQDVAGPLVSFEGEKIVPKLELEGDYRVFNPAWFQGVTFTEVHLPQMEPMDYAEFLAYIGK